jgi:hypothetical protein
MQSHNITIDAGDIVAICEGALLAGTWVWALRVKRSWSGWREKSALLALLCATVAVLADLGLTIVMHFRGENTFVGMLFLVALVGSLLLGTAGIVFGILGRGSPRIAGLLWSCLTLISVASSVFLAATQ